jgi:hypothetical protein
MPNNSISPDNSGLLADINKAAHAAGTDAWVRDVLQRAYRAVRHGGVAQSTAPEGWKFVPVHPTVEMQRAGFLALDHDADCNCDQKDVWDAMLAVVPLQQRGEGS